jgi:hypothetical protein
MSQCCFYNMNCHSVEINFTHNFTRFLSERNRQTALPSLHTPTLSVAESNDHMFISSGQELPAWAAGRLLSSMWALRVQWCVHPQGRDRVGRWGKRALHLAFHCQEATALLSRRRGTGPLPGMHLLPHELCIDEVSLCVTTMSPH